MSSQWAHCEKDGARVLGESQSDGANSQQSVKTTPNCQKDVEIVFGVTTFGDSRGWNLFNE